MRKADEWTLETWKTEHRLIGLDVPDVSLEATPLWKDLTFASVIAALLWAGAALMLA